MQSFNSINQRSPAKISTDIIGYWQSNMANLFQRFRKINNSSIVSAVAGNSVWLTYRAVALSFYKEPFSIKV